MANKPDRRLCRYGKGCKNPTCPFEHPDGKDPNYKVCFYGKLCARDDCTFEHPEGKDPNAVLFTYQGDKGKGKSQDGNAGDSNILGVACKGNRAFRPLRLTIVYLVPMIFL